MPCSRRTRRAPIISSQDRGTTPLSQGRSPSPNMVKVFPLPVCPYTSTTPLSPFTKSATIGCPVDVYTSSCDAPGEKTRLNWNCRKPTAGATARTVPCSSLTDKTPVLKVGCPLPDVSLGSSSSESSDDTDPVTQAGPSDASALGGVGPESSSTTGSITAALAHGSNDGFASLLFSRRIGSIWWSGKITSSPASSPLEGLNRAHTFTENLKLELLGSVRSPGHGTNLQRMLQSSMKCAFQLSPDCCFVIHNLFSRASRVHSSSQNREELSTRSSLLYALFKLVTATEWLKSKCSKTKKIH
mmetsp:Transcript_31440/g.72300  ORF Transcript_31440/g.72300 Transcript_31440/m.72300 type:complete len:300 (+) Transcript_31440:885-1784(+)